MIGDAAETTAGKMRILEASLRDVREGFLAAFSTGFMSNLENQLDGISGNFGMTTAEFGRFLGYLLSPEPQRALDFLEELKSDAGGADRAMLQLARQFGPVAQAALELQQIANTRRSGERGGLLGNLFGDPGESLADMQARIDAINEPMRQMIALRDQLAREATTARRQEFGGFLNIDTSEMSEASQVMLDVAANAGTASEQLYDAAGGGEAVGQAMLDAAAKARAAQLGEAMAAGLITGKQAAEDLQAFIDSMTLDKLFALDEPIAGAKEVAETAKQEMLRVVEGIDTSVTTAATPAQEAIATLNDQLLALDDEPANMVIEDNTEETSGNLINLRRYWDNNIVGQSTDWTINVVTNGEWPPGAEPPPPPGRARGGPVAGGRAYVVGEQGPELFIPGSSGQIAPATSSGAAVGMGSPVMVNQNFNGLGIAGAIAVSRRVLANYTRGTR